MKEGVSGSLALSNSVGINKYISEKKIDAAMQFIKYIASKEVQKDLVINHQLVSAMESIYNDTEVCNVINCDMIHGAMPFTSMNNSLSEFGNDRYRRKYRQYMNDYMFGGVKLMDTLDNIENSLTIYSFSLKTDDTVAGLILFIIVMLTLITMGLFLSLFIIKKISEKSKYTLWVISCLGSVLIMINIVTQFDDLTKIKCDLRLMSFSCGLCICIVPSLYIFLERRLHNNKSSFNIEKYKYFIILGLILPEILLNVLSILISSAEVELCDITYGKNFQKCNINGIFGKLIYYFINSYLAIVSIAVLTLIFTEYNSMRSTSLDLKTIIVTIFINLILFIFYLIINKIKIDNYIAYNILSAVIAYLLSVSDYFLIYGRKMILTLIIGDPDEKNEKNDPSNFTTLKSNEVIGQC